MRQIIRIRWFVALVCYVITPIGSAQGTCPCPGDVNGDLRVDGADIQGFVECLINGSTLAGDCSAADMNRDGVIDSTDAAALANALLGSDTLCIYDQQAAALQDPASGDPSPLTPDWRETLRSFLNSGGIVIVLDGASPGAGPAEAARAGVSVTTGEFRATAADLDHLESFGEFDFMWARRYGSRTSPNTAQGNGWDYCYDIWIEPVGPDMRLHNGWGRADLICRQPNGTWAGHELFGALSTSPDGSFAWTFPNTGAWRFRPLDGSAAQGKISAIVDRNGNSLTCTYDVAGRLVQVSDALGRALAVAYNADGYIASVTDFTGRAVQYSYYHNGDAGGAAGDLKSVTSPAVTGTPNGNDFPLGKATTYTYSTGFADARLNHNLLTMVFPNAHLWLTNTYSSVPDTPQSQQFDWLVHMDRALTGPMDLIHVPAQPMAANNYAVAETILNDGVGNVHEYYCDGRNRIVLRRDYTGRADPTQPTTPTTNRPGPPLRADDPPYFEWRMTFNPDSLPTQIIYPELNEEDFSYDSQNPDPRARGNMLLHCWRPGPRGGDQTQVCESWLYDSVFNFATQHTDGRGNSTFFTYDAHGNRLSLQERIPSVVHTWEYNSFGRPTAHVWPDNGSGHHRRDEFTYYASGPQRGYLASAIVDAGGLALTTQYEHDAVGNVVRVVDPRGNDTLLTVNALNQVVQVRSPEKTPGSGIRSETLYWYDANNNPVRSDVTNLNDQWIQDSSNHRYTRIVEYDTLNRPVRACGEIGGADLDNFALTCAAFAAGQAATTEYVWDATGNLTLVRHGEATNGHQPANVTRALYDERDLLYRVVRGEGDPAASTTQYDYNGNSHRKAIRQGLESAPRVTTFAYDGFDRQIGATDAMGNLTTWHYDPDGNMTSFRIDGEPVDVPGGAGNVRLAEAAITFDLMDRATNVQEVHCLLDQTPIGDGQATTQYFYSDNSQVVRVVDDNNHETRYAYDGANRRNVITDAKGNSITYTFDANGNAIRTVELDKSDLANPDRSLTTQYTFDSRNRLVATLDNAGSLDQYGYDSRNNPLTRLDARGNLTGYTYDGLSRPIQVTRVLTDTGDGTGNVIGSIVTTSGYDDSSRVIAQTDANGNATSYLYDALNRRTRVMLADGTVHTAGYDVHDNPTTRTDANGSSFVTAYDPLNRPTSVAIIPGAGVASDTTQKTYQYDGLSRCVLAQDDDSRVQFQYDSLSLLTRETQQILPAGLPRTIVCTYDGVGNCTRVVYPGGRTLNYSYDNVNRVASVSDAAGSTPFPAVRYVGPSRIERLDAGNGTRLDMSYDAFRRAADMQHSVALGGTIIDHRQFTWDGMNNKRIASDLSPVPQDRLFFSYDSVNRLGSTQAQPSGAMTSYALDGVGNRTSVSGGPGAGLYFMDPTMPAPADRQVNQYTTTLMQGRQYDNNGNLTRIDPVSPPAPPGLFSHDADNNLVQFTNQATGTVATYRHDALGRRIETNVGGTVTRSYYLGGREVETQDGADETLSTVTRVRGDWSDDGKDLMLTVRRCAPPVTVENQSFSSPPQRWAFIGTASYNAAGGSVRLVNSGQQNTAGATFFAQPIISDYFQVEFDYRIANATGGVADISGAFGPDGLACFVTGSPPAATGEIGRGLGYNGFPAQSFAVELDAFQNPAYNDPDSNHVGLDVGGSVNHTGSSPGCVASAPVTPNFETPGTWHVRIRCQQGQVQIYLTPPGGTTMLALTAAVPPGNIPLQKFIGFSSGNGLNSADVDIDNVTIKLLSDCNAAPQAEYYLHADDLGSVVKATDASGQVVEQYRYSDYGVPSFLDGSGAPLLHSQIGNTYLFTGDVYAPEMQMYRGTSSLRIRAYDRMHRLTRGMSSRTYDPTVGRYIERSGGSAWDCDADGNGYAYAGNNPASHRDYCVQYRETDFNFASRLMEEEGIYYYFKHRERTHATVGGTSTAVLVGPPGEEIYTDKYGRIKVQFFWDREGKRDANSSCWIRVASAYAGKQWGATAIPRIGQEVIVDFLEGDPDRPIIIGSMYNSAKMPACQLASVKGGFSLPDFPAPAGPPSFDNSYILPAIPMPDPGNLALRLDGVSLLVPIVNPEPPIRPISGHSSAFGDDGPTESISFNYGAIKVEYTPQVVEGKVDPAWAVVSGGTDHGSLAPGPILGPSKGGGGCGATGLEAVPFLFWYLRAKRAVKSRRK